MRFSLVFLSVLLTLVGCAIDDDPSRRHPREVCNNGVDDDGDGYVDAPDQDCWPADGGPAPAADAGPTPAADGGPTPPARAHVRLYWRAEAGMDLRFVQIQGCRGGSTCERTTLTGRGGPCRSEGPEAMECILDDVSVGDEIYFNAYGELAGDGTEVWGVGLSDGAARVRGTMFVSIDDDRDGELDEDRTASVEVVPNRTGDGRDWRYVVGR